MDGKTDDKTPRITPRSLEFLVGDTLTSIFAALDAAPDSPHVRELRSKARSYEQIVATWTSAPPTGPQREALFDLVIQLHARLSDLRASQPPPLARPRRFGTTG